MQDLTQAMQKLQPRARRCVLCCICNVQTGARPAQLSILRNRILKGQRQTMVASVCSISLYFRLRSCNAARSVPSWSLNPDTYSSAIWILAFVPAKSFSDRCRKTTRCCRAVQRV